MNDLSRLQIAGKYLKYYIYASGLGCFLYSCIISGHTDVEPYHLLFVALTPVYFPTSVAYLHPSLHTPALYAFVIWISYCAHIGCLIGGIVLKHQWMFRLFCGLLFLDISGCVVGGYAKHSGVIKTLQEMHKGVR